MLINQHVFGGAPPGAGTWLTTGAATISVTDSGRTIQKTNRNGSYDIVADLAVAGAPWAVTVPTYIEYRYSGLFTGTHVGVRLSSAATSATKLGIDTSSRFISWSNGGGNVALAVGRDADYDNVSTAVAFSSSAYFSVALAGGASLYYVDGVLVHTSTKIIGPLGSTTYFSVDSADTGCAIQVSPAADVQYPLDGYNYMCP